MTLLPSGVRGKVQRRTAWVMQLPIWGLRIVLSWTTAEGTLPVPLIVNWMATRPLSEGSRARTWL